MMKLQETAVSLAMIALASLSLLNIKSSKAEASNRFFCSYHNGIPSTMVQTSQGTKPLIQWKVNFDNWSPQQRCKEVTQKFKTFKSIDLNFLTVDRKQGYNILCTAKTNNNSCQRQMATTIKSKSVFTNSVATHGTLANSIKPESSLLFLMLGMTTTVGLSLLKHTIPETHDPKTGLIDGILFADMLGLSHEEMAKLLDRTVAGLRKNPTSDKLQPTLLKLYVLTIKLRGLLDDSIEKVRIYLHSPHPDLNYQTPLSYLLDGQFEEIEAIINCLEKQKIVA